VVEKPIRFEQLCLTVLHAVNSGIQHRLLQEKIKTKLSLHDFTLVSNSLKTISMLRTANFDRLVVGDSFQV
jgi:hypothetical protein